MATSNKSGFNGFGCLASGMFTGLGMVAAAAISWDANHSFTWMLAHSCFSWGYLIYYGLGGGH